MSTSINDSIKEHVLDPDNCHCTIRVLTSETTAIAYDWPLHKKGVKKIVAYVSWKAIKNGRHKVKVNMEKAHEEISICIESSETSADIDAKITAMFVEMDTAYTT